MVAVMDKTSTFTGTTGNVFAWLYNEDILEKRLVIEPVLERKIVIKRAGINCCLCLFTCNNSLYLACKD